jgi:serine/threonine-protein kinase RsbW
MYHHGKEHRERLAMIDPGARESMRRIVLQSLAELRPVADKVEDWMRVLGFSRKDFFAVRLALEEAVVNAFRHGTRGEPGKAVRVSYVVTPDDVFVEVEDDGPGFDPGLAPDPLAVGNVERVTGRGLFLMRAYMTGVSFNAQGNRVALWRRRSGA